MTPSNGWFDYDGGRDLTRNAGRQWKSQAALSLCDLTGLDDPVAAMRQLVAGLVADCELDRPAENLRLVASFQGIVAIETTVMADAGRLVPSAKGLIIQVNQSHNLGRQNFSICHEICHTLIPSYNDGLRGRSDPCVGEYDEEKEEEYLCDIGAAELLLPRQPFLVALRTARAQGNAYLAMLPLLAQSFKASVEATGMRLVQIGLPNTALLVWACPPATPANPRLLAPYFPVSQVAGQAYNPLTLRYAHRSGRMDRHFFLDVPLSPSATLIYRAQLTDEIVEGFQDLPTRQGIRRFWTQSQCFSIRRETGLEHRVISIVSDHRF